MKGSDNFWIGFAIGAVVPVAGFFLIEETFNFLTLRGIIDETTLSTMVRRQRTMALIAICVNIIPVNILKNQRYEKALRGVIVATFAYAMMWFYTYYSSIIF